MDRAPNLSGSGNDSPRAVSSAAGRTFRQFYDVEVHNILAYLIVMTGDRAAAEDLTQEAFTRAFKRWDDVGDYDSPGGWVHRVAHNLAVSRFRRLASEARALLRLRARRHPSAGPDEPPLADDQFWSEVRRLPERQRQAVALYYLEDRPVAEIAERMGCAESTAKVHLHRARRRLADRLNLDLHEGGTR